MDGGTGARGGKGATEEEDLKEAGLPRDRRPAKPKETTRGRLCCGEPSSSEPAMEVPLQLTLLLPPPRGPPGQDAEAIRAEAGSSLLNLGRPPLAPPPALPPPYEEARWWWWELLSSGIPLAEGHLVGGDLAAVPVAISRKVRPVWKSGEMATAVVSWSDDNAAAAAAVGAAAAVMP